MGSAAQLRPLVVFADDWGRHPSSCQHLVRHLLGSRSITWVNTIGTRPPRLDLGTARRAAGKLRGWASPKSRATSAAGTGPAPRVISPKMWPSFASRFGRGLNRRLLARALSAGRLGLSEAPVVLTTLPITVDVVPLWPGARWVYYCVDDFSVWPGYDGATMGRLERELVPKMHKVVAVSETLRRHLATLGAESELLTHGVDLAHWRHPAPSEWPEFADLPRPWAVFWGVIDRRLDLAFLSALAERMTAGTVLLVGPREDPDPRLDRIPKVAVRGAVPFARLPSLAREAAVLVMPYADLPVTRAMQPLKLKEYLVAGRPVVVRDLPSVGPWRDALDAVDTPVAFADAVLARLGGEVPPGQAAARGRLSGESWAAKAQQLAGWLDAPPGG